MIRVSTRGLPLLALLVATLVASACAGEDFSLPAAPTPTETTDTFAGTLSVNGGTTFQFLSNRGTVTATLRSVAPDPTIAVGLSLGTWNGATCSAVLSNDSAIQGSVIYATVNATGLLCVRVYDVGKLVEPLTFELGVVHF